jgi:hypothetical protein
MTCTSTFPLGVRLTQIHEVTEETPRRDSDTIAATRDTGAGAVASDMGLSELITKAEEYSSSSISDS